MDASESVRRPKRQSRRWIGAALLLLALALIAPHLASGTEMVRLRNAMSLGSDLTASDDWTPPAVPADFKVETVAPDAYFIEVARRLGLDDQPDDWSRAQAITRHLHTSAPNLVGGPIQRNLQETHRRIVGQGEGYCGDFVRVFQALAYAAGMTVRPWAFSFDGFGGHGHIWVEVWSRQHGRWLLVDVYDNYYFTDGESVPVSAAAFRSAMLERSPRLAMARIVPEARPGYEIESKAWDYFRRGLDQWYAPWGSNVQSVDAAWLVRALGAVSRAGEGLGALAMGLQPQVRLLPTATNTSMREALRGLRLKLVAVTVLAALGLPLLFWPRRMSRATRAPETRPTGPIAEGWPRVCIVGPLPPPSGGMANQCEQLLRLLRSEGVDVRHVRTNAPYRPQWVGQVPVVRAGFRLLPYVLDLWRQIGKVQVVHLFANSGWAWHLLAWPALKVAAWRQVPVIVNYRGGQADAFFAQSSDRVLSALRSVAMRVTPSPFLVRVFARHGLSACIVPNIIDLGRFRARPLRPIETEPHLIVTRNLEPIYDVPTAIEAFRIVRQRYPRARLTIAGSGPELERLQAIVRQAGLGDAVVFSGRIDNARIAALYADADVVLNPSTADNMPISVLEAMASGVPVVSTDAGGIPDLVSHECTALLVPIGDFTAMAAQVLRLLDEPELASRLREAGLTEAARYGWTQIKEQWRLVYGSVVGPAVAEEQSQGRTA